MNGHEIVRHLLVAFVYLSALSLLLLRNATSFDHTEGETLAQMAVICGATIFCLWAAMSRLRARWYAGAAVAFVLLLALTCAHEITGRLWASVAHIPGETDRAWLERVAHVAADRIER